MARTYNPHIAGQISPDADYSNLYAVLRAVMKLDHSYCKAACFWGAWWWPTVLNHSIMIVVLCLGSWASAKSQTQACNHCALFLYVQVTTLHLPRVVGLRPLSSTQNIVCLDYSTLLSIFVVATTRLSRLCPVMLQLTADGAVASAGDNHIC